MKIFYYITAHGYGHGVRSCDVINALYATDPELDLELITGLPRDFLESRLGHGRFTLRDQRFDLGMVQIDSVRVDIDETLRRLQNLLATAEKLQSSEQARLEAAQPDVVVSDIAPIPLAAARTVGFRMYWSPTLPGTGFNEEFSDRPGCRTSLIGFAICTRAHRSGVALPFFAAHAAV